MYFSYAFPKLSTMNISVQRPQVNFVDSIPENANGYFPSLEKEWLKLLKYVDDYNSSS